MTRLVSWLAGLILIVQLLGASQHHHDLAHGASDCAACVLVAQLPSPPGPPAIAAAPSGAAFVHYVLAAPAPVAPPQAIDFLIPHAQAPPARFM